MSNQRNLKAFVRYDGSGRVVAGSLVLRKNKPKVGKWKEIITYECCNFEPTTSTTTSTTTIVAICDTLGSAVDFAVLGASTVTNTGATVITGDLGLYPGTSVTGFPPGTVIGTQHITDVDANNAETDAMAAFVSFNALPIDFTLGADIGGTTVLPGVYDVASSLGITGTVVLDGNVNPDSVFIFQIPTTFISEVGSIVSLTNGAQAGNVYWIVGSSATLGVGSTVVGNIIAQASVTLNTNASLTGKAFALTGAVTLDTNNVTNAVCTINPLV